MKKANLLLAITLFSFTCYPQETLFSTFTNWQTILKNAKKSNKQIFLYFGATWCVPCKQLKSGVFSDPSTQKKLLGDFQLYEFDMDKENATAFLKKYRIMQVPTIIILDKEGYLKANISSIPQDTIGFQEMTDSIFRQGFVNKYISNQLELPFPWFYNEFFETRFKKNPDSLTISHYFDSTKNMFSEMNWDILTVFNVTNEKYLVFFLNNKEEYLKRYGYEVHFKLFAIYQSLSIKYIEQKDSVHFNKLLTQLLPNPDSPNYKLSMESSKLKTIRFLALTAMDWPKFVKLTNDYLNTYGNKNTYFILNYTYNLKAVPDSVNKFLLNKIDSTNLDGSNLEINFEYGVLLLKTGNKKNADYFFQKALDLCHDENKRKKILDRIGLAKNEYL